MSRHTPPLSNDSGAGLAHRLATLEKQIAQIEQVAHPRMTYATESGKVWTGNLLAFTITHGFSETPKFASASLVEGGSIFFDTNYIGVKLTATQATFYFNCSVSVTGSASIVCWLCIA